MYRPLVVVISPKILMTHWHTNGQNPPRSSIFQAFVAVVLFPDCATRHKSDWGRDYRSREYAELRIRVQSMSASHSHSTGIVPRRWNKVWERGVSVLWTPLVVCACVRYVRTSTLEFHLCDFDVIHTTWWRSVLHAPVHRSVEWMSVSFPDLLLIVCCDV